MPEKLFSIFHVKMGKIVIIIALMPFLLFACSALKPIEKLSDRDLIDKYYKTDLKIYMVRRDSGKNSPTKSDQTKGYAGKELESGSKDLDKINKLWKKLEVLRQELVRRGYMP